MHRGNFEELYVTFKKQMTAACIEYEDFDIGHSEFVLLDQFCIHVTGEWHAGVQIKDVKLLKRVRINLQKLAKECFIMFN